jgi:RNA polymerase sigma factor (sigma-70 family)
MCSVAPSPIEEQRTMTIAIEARSWNGLEELRGGLLAALRARCVDENEVDDVIQETFLRAARFRALFGEPHHLDGWAMRIALNVLTDRHRRHRRVRASNASEREIDGIAGREAVPGEEAPQERFHLGSHEIEKEDALSLLDAACRQLREDDRAVLSSFYGGRGSCRETGAACGLSSRVVKLRLFRARRRLLLCMRRRLALAGADPGGPR